MCLFVEKSRHKIDNSAVIGQLTDSIVYVQPSVISKQFTKANECRAGILNSLCPYQITLSNKANPVATVPHTSGIHSGVSRIREHLELSTDLSGPPLALFMHSGALFTFKIQKTNSQYDSVHFHCE